MFLYLRFFVMNREEKIQAIYNGIANKEVSFWCIAKHTTKWWIICDVVMIWQMVDWEKYFVVQDTLDYDVEWVYENDWVIKIIWHPVMIGDVIAYLRKCFYKFVEWHPVGINGEVDRYFNNIKDLLIKWYDTRLSIDKQDDECVGFVYSLIKN